MDNLKDQLKEERLDALLVTNPVNIFYLVGFKGLSPTEREAIIVATRNKTTLVTAKLYQSEAKKLSSPSLDIEIVEERGELEEKLKKLLKNAKTIGFEGHDLKFTEHKKYRKILKGKKFKSSKEIVEKLRLIKTKAEIENIEKAQVITNKAFFKVIETIKPGDREIEISERLVKIMASLGSQQIAFDPIVASGPNSALPHYLTGKREVGKNDVLLLDFGAKYENYCADFSRTIFVGSANNQQKKMWHLVFKAQQESIKKIAAGCFAKTIHNTAIKIFEKEKLEKNFIHSIGHGIGLEVHEKPSVSRKSKDKLEPGMVFSVEPGLYFNWGGIRIEDLVTIKNNKPTLLGRISPFIEIV